MVFFGSVGEAEVPKEEAPDTVRGVLPGDEPAGRGRAVADEVVLARLSMVRPMRLQRHRLPAGERRCQPASFRLWIEPRRLELEMDPSRVSFESTAN